MTPLIRQDGPAAQGYASDCRQDTDPAVRPGTAPEGQAMRPRVTAASVPPLSGGPGSHGSAAAAHAFTIADSVGSGLSHDGLCRRQFWDDDGDRGAYGLAVFRK